MEIFIFCQHYPHDHYHHITSNILCHLSISSFYFLYITKSPTYFLNGRGLPETCNVIDKANTYCKSFFQHFFILKHILIKKEVHNIQINSRGLLSQVKNYDGKIHKLFAAVLLLKKEAIVLSSSLEKKIQVKKYLRRWE